VTVLLCCRSLDTGSQRHEFDQTRPAVDRPASGDDLAPINVAKSTYTSLSQLTLGQICGVTPYLIILKDDWEKEKLEAAAKPWAKGPNGSKPVEPSKGLGTALTLTFRLAPDRRRARLSLEDQQLKRGAQQT